MTPANLEFFSAIASLISALVSFVTLGLLIRIYLVFNNQIAQSAKGSKNQQAGRDLISSK